ncbi:MAG: beta-aspartyl-peptidase [Bacteroidales bacterium]|nr:beta-aspartyl-peptidase [Bacteroidales bacterium]MDT8432382.1 beta-aspartyl-peptidase [Bacteroidales bacterium]
MKIRILKNARLFTPVPSGMKDILIVGEKIVSIEKNISWIPGGAETTDLQGKTVTPGLIDQHIHITGAGGKQGYHSMTPDTSVEDLISCGTTTVLGLLGTDGVARSLNGLYAKVRALELEGVSAYMLTSYFGLPPLTFTGSVLNDMVLIDKVLGCKIAISDPRSSFPTENELLKILREVHVGGLTSGKGGILHVHLGAMETGMSLLLDMVKKHKFPIQHISPTHVGRTKPLFEEAIEFAKLGGIIDISTGGTKYDEPYKQVLYALDQGVPVEQMTFSSDGNAGMAKKNKDGEVIGFYKAPIDLNLANMRSLVSDAGLPLEQAITLITSNPARNLSLKHKGRLENGCDADLCVFEDDLSLCDVMARGAWAMKDKKILFQNAFST